MAIYSGWNTPELESSRWERKMADMKEAAKKEEDRKAAQAEWEANEAAHDAELAALAEAHPMTPELIAKWLEVQRKKEWEAANWAAMPEDCDWQLPPDTIAQFTAWATGHWGIAVQELISNKCLPAHKPEENKILNLTQHPASPEQRAAGVIDPSPALKKQIQGLITFDDLPTPEFVAGRAIALAGLVESLPEEFKAAMIGGAPFFMAPLERELLAIGCQPLYAFSRRIVEESADGSEKRAFFRHEGFVPATE